MSDTPCCPPDANPSGTCGGQAKSACCGKECTRGDRCICRMVAYIGAVLLLGLLAGIANNLMREGEGRLDWFKGQTILEKPE